MEFSFLFPAVRNTTEFQTLNTQTLECKPSVGSFMAHLLLLTGIWWKIPCCLWWCSDRGCGAAWTAVGSPARCGLDRRLWRRTDPGLSGRRPEDSACGPPKQNRSAQDSRSLRDKPDLQGRQYFSDPFFGISKHYEVCEIIFRTRRLFKGYSTFKRIGRLPNVLLFVQNVDLQVCVGGIHSIAH